MSDPTIGGAPTDLTMHIDPTGSLLDATVAFEQAVWSERYGVAPEDLAQYHARWDRASVFVTLADDFGQVRAMIRFVYPSPAGLPTLVDIAEEPWNADPVQALSTIGISADQCWDIATIAVAGELARRSHLLVAALYHAVHKVAVANDVRGMVAVIDERVRRALAAFSLPVATIPGTSPEPFWGSPATTPVWMDILAMAAQQRRTAPEAHRLVVMGVGLDGIRIPSQDQFVIHRSAAIELPRQSEGHRVVDLSGPSHSDRELLES